MASSTAQDDTVAEIARRWMEMEKIQPVATEERLLERKCCLKHVAWKFNETFNEIWIDGKLGVVFTANETAPSGEKQTKVDYDVKVTDEPKTKTQFYAVEIAELAKWHLAWLTDPNVWIESATIDMEFDQKYLVEKRKFQIQHINISVQTNYPTVHGWLQHMQRGVESLIYRGNGIMDANKFLQLPYAIRLRKLVICYESSFDDRLILQLTAEHLQISSDFLTDVGINKLLHRWNDMSYAINSNFLIYVPIKNTETVVKDMPVTERKDHGAGVIEYLIEMLNPRTRMRVTTRPSSVTCSIFALTNAHAPPPLRMPDLSKAKN